MTTPDLAELNGLAESDCWALLRSATVGRLAVIDGDRPDIFPVNFAVDHASVVFRSAEGTKLRALRDGCVAFEVDGTSSDGLQAWSVVVKGTVEALRTAELAASVAIPVRPMHPAPKPRILRLLPEQISGRRFAIADTDVWRTALTDARPSASE